MIKINQFLILPILAAGLSNEPLQAFSTRICNNTKQQITVKLHPSFGNCPAGIEGPFTIKPSSSTDFPWNDPHWHPKTGTCLLQKADNSIEVNGAALSRGDITVNRSYNEHRGSETITIQSKPHGGFTASLFGHTQDCASHTLGYATCADGTTNYIGVSRSPCWNCRVARRICDGAHGGLKPGSWPSNCDAC